MPNKSTFQSNLTGSSSSQVPRTDLIPSLLPHSDPTNENSKRKVRGKLGDRIDFIAAFFYFYFKVKSNPEESILHNPETVEYSGIFIDEENPEAVETIIYKSKQLLATYNTLKYSSYSTSNFNIPEDLTVDPSCLKICQKIDNGSFADVYAAKYCQYKEIPVALKVLQLEDHIFSHDEIQSINEEITILQSFILHKNIITLLGVCANTEIRGNDGESIVVNFGLMMELSTIGNLKNFLRESGMKVDNVEKLCISFALDIANGLNALHSFQCPIIHRDLKSENVLLFPGKSDYGETIVAKISGFGITNIKRIAINRNSTKSDTSNFLSPQAIDGIFNEASDIWAFGMVLYEIGTEGKLPFEGMEHLQVMMSIDRKKLPDTTIIKEYFPSNLKRTMFRCWELEQTCRPCVIHVIKMIQLDASINDVEMKTITLRGKINVLESSLEETTKVVAINDAENQRLNEAIWENIKLNDDDTSSLMDELRVMAILYSRKPRQPTGLDYVESLLNDAAGPYGQKLFHFVLAQLVGEGGAGTFIKGPLKTRGRSITKVNTCYEGNAKYLVDVIRCSVIFESCGEFKKFVHLLKNSEFIHIVGFKDWVNNPLTSKYRNILVNLKVVSDDFHDISCQVGELQLHFKSMYKRKPEDHGHKALIV